MQRPSAPESWIENLSVCKLPLTGLKCRHSDIFVMQTPQAMLKKKTDQKSSLIINFSVAGFSVQERLYIFGKVLKMFLVYYFLLNTDRLSAHILVIDYIWKTPGNSIYFQINICR